MVVFVRGWLGIGCSNTVEDDVLAAETGGVIVADVLRDGPARCCRRKTW